MGRGLLEKTCVFNKKILNSWYESVSLPVAPMCNMMCNFCMRDADCICNGNDPSCLSRIMTPRQAVSHALSEVRKNSRARVIKITGPGEPLYNEQTFETLRRLNNEMPEFIFIINTNGLLLKEKIEELKELNVRMINVSVNAASIETAARLYSRIAVEGTSYRDLYEMSEKILNLQYEGIKECIAQGIRVGINTLYLRRINEDDIKEIALKYKRLGVKSMSLISKFQNNRLGCIDGMDFSLMENLRYTISKIMDDVEIKSFGT